MPFSHQLSGGSARIRSCQEKLNRIKYSLDLKENAGMCRINTHIMAV